ncbi:MAG: PqqD family protein [Anaerolineae bacterium]|nr:PqqD family protein [Anaerolineae bacterium]
MTLRDTTTFRTVTRQVSNPLASGSVVLSLDDGVYYTLNDVGALLWNLLAAGPQTIAALRETVLAEYDITPETCADDVDRFIHELLAAKLIEEVRA